MKAKTKIILCSVAAIAASIMAVVLFQVVFAIYTFKTPQEEKYAIDYIKVGRAAVWLMQNQQNDYDNRSHEHKIYFFMSNKIIHDESKLFETLSGKYDFPKDEDFYLYVYKKSRRLPKYWVPEHNKFMLDIIDMHEDDLYLKLKCKNNTFEVVEKEKSLFKD